MKPDDPIKIGFSDLKVTKSKHLNFLFLFRLIVQNENNGEFDIDAPINYDINKESLDLKIDYANFDIDLNEEEGQVKIFEEKGILEWNEVVEIQTPEISRRNFLKNLNDFSNQVEKSNLIISKGNSSTSKSVIFQEPTQQKESNLSKLSEVRNRSPEEFNFANQQNKRKIKVFRSHTQTFGEKTKDAILKNPEQLRFPCLPPTEKIYIKVKDMEIQTEDIPIALKLQSQAQIQLGDNIKSKEGGANMIVHEEIKNVVNERFIIKLQKAFKKCLNKIYFQRKAKTIIISNAIKILLYYFKMKRHRKTFLLAKSNFRKDYVPLHSSIIRMKAPEYALVHEYICELRVSLVKSAKALKWVLINIDNKNIYKTNSSIDSILSNNLKIDSIENLKKIQEYLQSRLSFLKIDRNKLTFEDEKENQKIDSVLTNENIEKVEKLQAFFKNKITLGNNNLKKKNSITYESRFLKKVSHDLFILFLQFKKNDKNFSYITGKLIGRERGQLNVLLFPNHILKYFLKITPENIFDIIEYDGGNKINFSEDVQSKFNRIEKLKNNDNSFIIQNKMIKIIQANFRGYLVRKKYNLQKGLKNFFRPIKVAFIIRKELSYFVRFSYKKLGNLLIINVFSFCAKKSSEISIKLFEIKKNSEILDMCEIVSNKMNIEIFQGMNEFRIITPKIEELQTSALLDLNRGNMDPFLNLKIEQNSGLSFIYARNSIILQDSKSRITYKNHVDFDVDSIIKIQRCYRTFVVKRNFKFCIDKNIERNNFNDYLKFYSIKEQEIKDYNREEIDSNLDFYFKKNKNKNKKSPYEKKRILIMKKKHKFNKNIYTQIKVSYDIYFKSIILKIIYSKLQKEQTFASTLESYGIKEFNKTYFKKNFFELVINHLKYDEEKAKFIYELKKMEEKIVNKDVSKKNFIHCNAIVMSPEEQRKVKNQQGFKLIKTMQQKINETYLKFEFYFDVHTNSLYYDAVKYDDPFNMVRTPFLLPKVAEKFLKEERVNIILSKTSKVYQIISHFIENSAFAENKEKAFQENLNFLEKIIRIQRIFRVKFAKSQIEQTKRVVNKSKNLLCRRFFKINDRYVDLMLFFCNQDKFFEIAVKFIEKKRENYKKFKVVHNEMAIFMEDKNNIDLKSFMKDIFEMISIKLIRNEIFIVSSSERIYIE